MPPNPERQERMRQKREEMANDPKLREAQAAAVDALLERDEPEHDVRSDAAEPPAPIPGAGMGPGGGRGAAPKASPPPLRAPSMRGGIRGGGSSGSAVHQITPQMRPTIRNPDAPSNPLGLSPNSPFKYEEGGKVKSRATMLPPEDRPPPPPRERITPSTMLPRNYDPEARKKFGYPETSFAKGGIVRGPFAQGGPVLPRSGGKHAK